MSPYRRTGTADALDRGYAEDYPRQGYERAPNATDMETLTASQGIRACVRRELLFLVGFIFLSVGCTTSAGKAFAQEDPQLASLQNDLASWHSRFLIFLNQAGALSQETTLLRNLPGWPDMERIIQAGPALRRFEGQEAADNKTQTYVAENLSRGRRNLSDLQSLALVQDVMSANDSRDQEALNSYGLDSLFLYGVRAR